MLLRARNKLHNNVKAVNRFFPSCRYLHLHEYQSLQLMREAGVSVQNGSVAFSPDEACGVAKRLVKESPGCDLIVKAQIHAGGRGKGTFSNGFQGGVQILKHPHEVHEVAKHMIGSNLITKQTTEEGQPVNALLINEGIFIEKEFYLAVLLDRKYGGPVIVASSAGGMDIEEVAEKNPDAITIIPIDITIGVTDSQADEIAYSLGLEGELKDQCKEQVKKLYNLFVERDATQVEINPLAIASNNRLYCVDAKLNFDDSASYRQAELFSMRDLSLEDALELRAEKANLNYVKLDGTIGCMVNGAGLAMATMDIINLYGGSPANFLDVGGGATKEQVKEAFRILTSDPNVKAILVNIFGGIMKCDIIASGIVAAAEEIHLDKMNIPLVVRLEGTNVIQGKKILEKSGIQNILTADCLDDAAKKVAELAIDGSLKTHNM